MKNCLPKKNWKNYYYTPTHRVWANMNTRCRNKENPNYKNYGGRGIVVCDRWKIFKNFFNDMGEKPQGLSLDRIDNNGNYSKENCRWATLKEQARNTRKSVVIFYNGVKYDRQTLAEFLGVNKDTISRRLTRGLPIDEKLRKGLGTKRIDISDFQFSKSRAEDMEKLRRLGSTMQQIGDMFGISRQRVWQILDNRPSNRV